MEPSRDPLEGVVSPEQLNERMAADGMPEGKFRAWHKHVSGGWIQRDGQAFSLFFNEKTEVKLLYDDSSKLQLQDVIQDVAEVELREGSVDDIKTLFDAINSSKPSRLRILSLCGGFNDAALVDILAESIQLGCLSSLEAVDMSGNDLGNGHFALAKAIASGGLPRLSKLELRATGLVDDQCEAYEIALAKLPSLTEIDLSCNKIGNKGADVLGRAIKSGQWKILETLFLHYNAIGDDGLNTLVSAIQGGETKTSMLPELRNLYLSDNPFTEVGVMALAQALQIGCLNSLVYLDIENSQKPSTEGGGAIVAALSYNLALKVYVRFEWDLFPILNRRYRQLRLRNSKFVDMLAKLKNDPWVPASSSKIYLCGNPKVGKTTLCHTLERTWLESLFTWERRPREENRTRGIDVVQILNKDIKLLVWDMAGQEDYHLVHNAFFPVLNFTQGSATTFIIVCTTADLEKAVKELDYWLRYIASSSDKIMEDMHMQDQSIQQNPSRPHVLVVLNKCKSDGKVAQDWENVAQDWIDVLENQRKKFIKYLDIQKPDDFLVDVRKRRYIQGLKRHIMEYSRICLENTKIPSICLLIQEKLPVWSKGKKQFPVLEWGDFLEEVYRVSGFKENDTIEAATKYLNEAGVLIYIDKAFSHEGLNPPRRLVVIDPNWFCKEIIGHIFLTRDMVRRTTLVFRMEVEPTMGSISESHFKTCFKSDRGKWTDQELNDLIAVLLWLGVCYKGKDGHLFFPALTAENGTPEGRWGPQHQHRHEEEQWVMGFLVEHQKNELTLAPMSLWHRFQVKLAQIPRFNGVQNSFKAAKYFMTFTVDFMDILIEVDANKDIPTFNQISILVKPMLSTEKDHLDRNERKQCQVDLASDLVEILLGHWNEVCPGVEYLHRVVWPWPVSQGRPRPMPERNVEVSQVKEWLEEHGLGRIMLWQVGSGATITEDQLLSKEDKRDFAIDTVEGSIRILREGMREAVELQIFPPDVLPDDVYCEESRVAIYENEEASQPMSPRSQRLYQKLGALKQLMVSTNKEVVSTKKVVVKMDKKLDVIQEGLREILKVQKDLLHKIQDTDEMFLQDKERTCPKYIYLGDKTSGAFRTLRDAYSETVRLQFACEAEYSDCGPHKVKDQEGVELSELKDWAKTIVPWLRVSLTVLLISAKIAANVVLPGVGILPSFGAWQQAQSLSVGVSEGITWLTGFSKEELDSQILEGMMNLGANPSQWDPRVLYGKSREAMTRYIGKLTPDAYEKKLGLRKVCLRHYDGSLRGVFWICSDCLEKYRKCTVFKITEL